MINNKILPFLNDLSKNNNREWFTENKTRFNEAKNDFSQFVDLLIAQLSDFDPFLKGLESKECIFRIYRDVRFSNDKRPYKTNFGAYMAPGGRKSMNTGYYIHIEPEMSFLGGGIYMPPAPQLKEIRTRIFEDPEQFLEIIDNDEFKSLFSLYNEDKLKTAPKGFPKDFEHIDLLRYKHYAPSMRLDKDFFDHEDYFSKIVDYFEIIKPFNDYIRECLV